MSNFIDRVKLIFLRNREFRSALFDIMGFYPHDVEVYRIAFAHKSQEYKSKKTGDRPLNNERLEYLGDAVLETVVSDIVYHHFKNKREGFLTNTRSKIVSRESLGRLAKELGIDRLIQSHTYSKAHNSFLAGNAFEALMGAIYLDRGFDFAFRFIEKRIIGHLLDLESVAHKEVNFKSKLLEYCQKNRLHIDFKDKQTNATGNNPSFETTIVIEGLFAGDGKGFSKKEAHQNASREALTRMRREPQLESDIYSSKEKRTAMEADPCFVLPVIDEIEADIAREAEKAKKGNNPRNNRENRDAEVNPQNTKPRENQKKAKNPQQKEKASNNTQNQQVETASKNSREQQSETPVKSENSHKEEVTPQQKEKKGPQTPRPNKIQGKPNNPAPAEAVLEAAANLVKEVKAEVKSGVTPKVEPAPVVVEAQETSTAEIAAASVETDTPSVDTPSVETVSEAPLNVVADAPIETPAPKKPRRVRGKRQNAVGFTNTEPVPAETSHRAEKAAAKVEEVKKEKSRRKAHKDLKEATTDMEIEGINANAAEDTPAEVPAKKPRRRRSTKKPAEADVVKEAAKEYDTVATSNEKEGLKEEIAPVKKPRRRSTRKTVATATSDASEKVDAAASEATSTSSEAVSKATPAPAKKSRRRKKQMADPVDGPHTENEPVISAAEEAALQNSDN